MTAEELEKKVEAYADEHFDDYRMTVGDLENAYIAGARENGFVWRDLLKDPEDLPGKGRVAFSHVVMINKGFREYCNTFTGEWFAAGTFELVDKPRAWCEIPEFEEE